MEIHTKIIQREVIVTSNCLLKDSYYASTTTTIKLNHGRTHYFIACQPITTKLFKAYLREDQNTLSISQHICNYSFVYDKSLVSCPLLNRQVFFMCLDHKLEDIQIFMDKKLSNVQVQGQVIITSMGQNMVGIPKKTVSFHMKWIPSLKTCCCNLMAHSY